MMENRQNGATERHLTAKKIMKVKGIQKTTLIDYPGQIACTIFLFGCNFRCGFCHNPELVLEDDGTELKEEELFSFLERRKDYLEGICITGGEPLMTLEKEFLKKIKDLGYLIKIDTNGSYPDKLREFIEEGLVDAIAMDIKSSKERYKEITAMDIDLDKIERSIRITSSISDHEFRTTVLKEFHDIEEIKRIANWLNDLSGKKPKRYALQSFKNKGKVLNKRFEELPDVHEEDLIPLKEEIKNMFEEVEIRE
jgi:pyruvate formate lyase activating enzyme